MRGWAWGIAVALWAQIAVAALPRTIPLFLFPTGDAPGFFSDDAIYLGASSVSVFGVEMHHYYVVAGGVRIEKKFRPLIQVERVGPMTRIPAGDVMFRLTVGKEVAARAARNFAALDGRRSLSCLHTAHLALNLVGVSIGSDVLAATTAARLFQGDVTKGGDKIPVVVATTAESELADYEAMAVTIDEQMRSKYPQVAQLLAAGGTEAQCLQALLDENQR